MAGFKVTISEIGGRYWEKSGKHVMKANVPTETDVYCTGLSNLWVKRRRQVSGCRRPEPREVINVAVCCHIGYWSPHTHLSISAEKTLQWPSVFLRKTTTGNHKNSTCCLNNGLSSFPLIQKQTAARYLKNRLRQLPPTWSSTRCLHHYVIPRSIPETSCILI